MGIDSENTETKTIARAFVKVIRERIPNETLVRIDAENAARVGTSGALLCSTDDHCDGNDAMIEAFRRCGKPYSDQWAACDAHAKLWGEVWEAAKRAGFADNDAWWCDGCCEEKPDATPTGLNDDGTTYCPTCDLPGSAEKENDGSYVVIRVERSATLCGVANDTLDIVALPALWVAEEIRNDDAWPILSTRKEASEFEDETGRCAVVLDDQTHVEFGWMEDSIRNDHAFSLISLIHTMHDEEVLSDDGVYYLCTDEGVAGAIERAS